MYIRGSAIAPLSVLVAGCHPTPPPHAPLGPATTQSAGPAPTVISGFDLLVAFPAGWPVGPLVAPEEEQETQAVAPAAVANGGLAKLTFDVPKLHAFHPFLPMGRVLGGYTDDVKKRMPDAAGPPATDIAVPDANARRVTLAGHNAAGRLVTEDAVLMVHGDRVYVLVADSDDAGRPAAKAALEAAVASVRWAK
jgi:hypothetical protein